MPSWLPRRLSGAHVAGMTIRVVAPTQDDVWLAGTAERQSLLALCDRSPAVFRLALCAAPDPSGGQHQQSGTGSYGQAATDDGDAVTVLDRDGHAVGLIPPRLAVAYACRLRRLHRRGVHIAVHGQVVRRDLDLCVVLHCPAPDRWADRWMPAAR